MSEAPRCTASVRMPLISLTTGASSICAWSAATLTPRRCPRAARRRPVLDGLEQLAEVVVLLDLVVLLEVLAERVLADDDRLDVVPRDELQVVDGAGVRRVRHGHGQHAADAAQRQDQVLHRLLAGISLMIFGSMTTRSRSTAGTRYCLASARVSSGSG
jgi:hypothetical protein